MIFELVKDYADALSTMPADHPKRRTLRLLEEAIRRDVHFIDRHPTTMFQCMWNTCWWYDCEEAVEHYEQSAGDGTHGCPAWQTPGPKDRGGKKCQLPFLQSTRRATSWEKVPGTYFPPSAKLHEFVELWAKHKFERTPDARWVRSTRPPPMQLGTGQTMVFRGDVCRSVAISSNNQRVAAGSLDGIRVWDVISGCEVLNVRSEPTEYVDFSPDGTRIALAGSVFCERSRASIRDSVSGEEVSILWHDERVSSVAYSPDGTKLATGCDDGSTRIWNSREGHELICTIEHAAGVTAVAWSPDSTAIVSGYDDRTARVWDVKTGEELCCFSEHGRTTEHSTTIESVAFSPDGKRIASAGDVYDGTVRVWNAMTADPLLQIEAKHMSAYCVAYSPDGDHIAGALSDGTVRVWSAIDGKQVRCLRGHTDPVNCVTFSADGQFIISGSRDETVRVWDVNAEPSPYRLSEDRTGYTRLGAISPDGQRIVTCALPVVRVWDVESGKQLHRFAKNAALRAVPGRRGMLRVAPISDDATTAKTEPDNDCGWFRGIEEPGREVYSPDGRLVAKCDIASHVLQLISTENGKPMRRLHFDYPVCSFAFSPDSQQIAIGRGSGTSAAFQIIDVRTIKELHCIKGHTSGVGSVAFSPDGHCVAAWSAKPDGLIRVWDANTGRLLQCVGPRRTTTFVVGLAFSPDGRRLVSGDSSPSVQVWDLATGRCIARFAGRGDIAAIAAASSHEAYQAFCHQHELVILDTNTRHPVGWHWVTVSEMNQHVTPIPVSRGWAWCERARLCIVRLEIDGQWLCSLRRLRQQRYESLDERTELKRQTSLSARLFDSIRRMFKRW